MAKQSYGILDGYRGSIGPVIGYQWRGKWCLRARPRRVRNPRTEAQQEHRMVFRDMVQLASRLKHVLRDGLYTASTEEHMTEGNLFVKTNKDCFTPAGVDYRQLQLSLGPVAPVAFTSAVLDEAGVLHVEFERNPLHQRADGDDAVHVYAYCPALQKGVQSAAVQRRSRRLSLALPDEWAGLEVHCYGFVTDYAKRASETEYIDIMEPATESGAYLGAPHELVADGGEEVLGVHSYEADGERCATDVERDGACEGGTARVHAEGEGLVGYL